MSTEKWKREHRDDMRRYRREYYYRNKQEHYDRNVKFRKKIRKFILDFKSKVKCIRCSERDPASNTTGNNTHFGQFHTNLSSSASVAQLFADAFLNPSRQDILQIVDDGGYIFYYVDYLGVAY